MYPATSPLAPASASPYGKPSSAVVMTFVVMHLTATPMMGQGGTASRVGQHSKASCVREARDVAGHDAPPCAGDLAVTLRNRAFLIPDKVVDGLKIQPTIGVRWSPTPFLTLELDNQTVDNSGPGRQGQYVVSRTVGGSGGSGNFLQETALAVDVQLLESANRAASLRLNGSLSRGVRSYHATQITTGDVVSGNRRELVPTTGLMFDTRSARARLSLGPAVVFLPASNALYLRVLPGTPDQHFGVTAGLRADASWRASAPLSLWARGFVPASGNNSISRGSGSPVRVPAWDAGIALHLNPALDAELFASNALGNTGALAFIADREYRAIGTGIVFRPFAPDTRYNESKDESSSPPLPPPLSRAASFVGASRRGSVSLAGGGQGLLASIDLSPAEGLRLGAYLDNVAGIEDEGELGASISMRLIDQSSSMPFTLAGTISGARTNNVLVNLLSGQRDEFVRRGYSKSGFTFGDESINEGKLYVLTGSVTAQHRMDRALMVWMSPTVAVIQRNGVQLVGVSSGLTGRLTPTYSLAAEVGVALSERGNTLMTEGRVRRVPWELALVREITLAGSQAPLLLRGYVTNRVGDSPFHSLRVRAGGRPTVGLGLLVPLGGAQE